MSNENIVNCISIDESGKVVNLVVGLDYTRNSTCVDMTDEFKYVQIGDSMKGEIVERDTEMGRAYGLRTIIDPEWVKKPLTPEELKQKWYMDKHQLENEIREVQFRLMFCQSRYQMANILGDTVSKDKELAKYQVLQAEQTTLETKLAELIANEPQG